MSRSKTRRGAMLFLVLACVVVLLAMALFSVDVAYMQMVQTENQIATDAAAKAGAEALSREQNSEAAIEAAINFAAQNKLAGKPVVLTRDDIVLGKAAQEKDGSWRFVADDKEPTAVRIRSQQTDVDLFFGKMFGTSYFSPEQVATAAHIDQEIVLAIDRSHSMCFDLSGTAWSYPPGIPSTPAYFVYPPHPTLSRWASLSNSINTFFTEASKVKQRPRVGLVTWGSEITLDSYEGGFTNRTFPAVRIEVPLGLDLLGIQTRIHLLGNDTMLGGTNMGAGMQAAMDMLTAPDTLPLAKKTIVLMTDGKWNEGQDPNKIAKDAKKEGIIIHTVTFLPGADEKTMKKVAKTTGGTHYHAENEAELQAAFRELARTLPVVLTD